MMIADRLDALALRLSRSTFEGADLAPERVDVEVAALLAALRGEVASGLAHGIDEAEIMEGIATMAQMHRFVVTGQHEGAF